MPDTNIYRRSILGFVPKSVDEASRSIEFQLSSEAPVRVFDWERGEPVREVLVSAGMKLPANNQLPLLDAHDRGSVKKVLGSVRQIRVDGDKPIGKCFFSRKDDAAEAFEDVKDGHLTDGSVGYEPLESVWIEPGQSFAWGGRTFAGPLKLTTSWLCKEFSLAPIGADENAKARSEADPEPETPAGNHSASRAETKPGGFTMNPKLYKLLISRGLAAGSTDEQALAFLESLPDKDAVRAEANKPDVQPAQTPVVDEAQVRADAERAAMERFHEIRENCRAAGMTEEFTAKTTKECASVEAARAAIFNELKARNITIQSQSNINAGESDGEKFKRAAVEGIIARASGKGASDIGFSRMSLLRLSEEFLRRKNVNTRGMSAMQIAGMALGLRGAYPIVGSTADFTDILYDAANKTIQKEYSEYPRQWSRFCSRTTVPDFKTIRRPQMAESPDLAEIAENGEYTEASFADNSESYNVTTYGKRFTISRKAIINDDLSAFSRIPRAFGAAASRKIEQLVFAILTANANMADGNALFSAAHSNLGSGEAFGATSVGELMQLIRLAKGPGTNSAPLGLMPKFLIVPVAHQFAAEITCNSAGYPVAEYSSGTVNPIRNAGIEVIASPILDASSALIHYMLADPSQIDTIEVAFLEGGEAPVLEELDQTDVDGRVYHVRIDVGAKALDWRGMARHAGA